MYKRQVLFQFGFLVDEGNELGAHVDDLKQKTAYEILRSDWSSDVCSSDLVSGAAGVIHGNTSIDIDATIAQMRTGMENMGVGELLGLSIRCV